MARSPFNPDDFVKNSIGKLTATERYYKERADRYEKLSAFLLVALIILGALVLFTLFVSVCPS